MEVRGGAQLPTQPVTFGGKPEQEAELAEVRVAWKTMTRPFRFACSHVDHRRWPNRRRERGHIPAGRVGESKPTSRWERFSSKGGFTPPGTRNRRRSRSAANARHARRSFDVRSGKSLRISASDIPDANSSRREPAIQARMQGLPPRLPGSIVIVFA